MFTLRLRSLPGIFAVAVCTLLIFVLGQHVFYTYVLTAAETAMLARPDRCPPLYCFETESPFVVLTFDVSWGEEVPLQTANMLAELGVSATFFVSASWARTHRDTVETMLSLGHDVASLGYSVVDYRKLSPLEVRADAAAARSILEDIPGVLHSIVRPPLGKADAEALHALQSVGYRAVFWDVDCGDWQLPASEITRLVLTRVQPGSIVRLHANDAYSQTPQMVKEVVAKLREQGLFPQPVRLMLRDP